jgi:hypothetical protein
MKRVRVCELNADKWRSCQHVNEPWYSIKDGECHDHDHELLKKDFAPQT